MLHSDNGNVQLKGDLSGILADYTILTKALLNEFDLDFVLTGVAVAVHHKDMPVDKVDLSGLATLLNDLKEGEE